MKNFKTFITIFSIFLVLAIYLTNIVFATSATYIPVTSDSLKAAYGKFLTKTDDSHFYAEVTDTAINIHSDEITNPLYYTISDNGVTFTINSTITPEMTYEEYSQEISKTILPLYGFIGNAIVQKANLSDAFTYIAADLLASDISKIPNFSSSMLSFSSSSYTQSSNGEKIEHSGNENFSAFEAVKLYDTPLLNKDTDEFSLYTWEVKKASSNDNQIVISSTLTANASDNYIKLDGYNEKYKDALNITNNSISMNRTDIIIQTTNKTNNTVINVPNKITTNNTITSLPKAGININLINIAKIVLIIAVVSIVLFTIYNISQKNDN